MSEKVIKSSGVLMVLASLFAAMMALVANTELTVATQDWGPRIQFDAWATQRGLYDFLHHPAVQLLLLCVPFALAGVAIRRTLLSLGSSDAPEPDATRRLKIWVFCVGAVCALLQCAIPAIWSSDIYAYSVHGRLAEDHGVNPLRRAGREFSPTCIEPGPAAKIASPGTTCRSNADCPSKSLCQHDPYVLRTPWSKHPSVYGPVAIELFKLGYDASRDDLQNGLMHRLLAVFAWLFVAVALGRWFGVRSMVLWLWFPVGWLEAGNGGHLEPWVALGLVGVMATWKSRPGALSVAPWAAATVLIKLSSLLFFLGFFLDGLKRRLVRPLILVSALSAAAILSVYLLSWSNGHPFEGLLAESGKSTRSPLHMIRFSARSLFEVDILVWVRLLGVGALILWCLQAVKRPAISALEASGQVWFIATCAVFAVFQPWHAIIGLLFASTLAAESRVRGPLLYLAFFSPLYTYGAWLAFQSETFTFVPMMLTTGLIFGPAIWLWFRLSD